LPFLSRTSLIIAFIIAHVIAVANAITIAIALLEVRFSRADQVLEYKSKIQKLGISQ
jgi:hypothetical protein